MRIRELRYVLGSIWGEESNRGQRWRRICTFFVWQLWKRVAGTPVEAKLLNGLRMQVWPDCDVSPAALYYALPNSRHISFLRKHLDGGTLLDVGANVGLVSLLLADKVRHAIMFEPNPMAAERARANCRLNHLEFEVVAQALSDKVGEVEFENAAGVSALTRIVEGFSTSMPTTKVQRTTFDQFWREHAAQRPPISAVKIDVEGHENAVLRGMKAFLKNQRPKLVMFEYLARTNIRQALETFHDVGYTVFELSAAGPRIATEEVTPLQDLFACPAELEEIFGVKR